MKYRLAGILLFCSILLFSFKLQAQDYKQFLNPSKTYRPWIFWDWVNDMVTYKGIRSDLEQFSKFGLSGTLIMLVGSETSGRQMWSDHHMPHPIISQTPEFFEAWKFAANESARKGLTISTQCGPGWCHSGGPWIRPNQAVQHIAYSELQLTGESRSVLFIIDSMSSERTGAYEEIPGQYRLLRPGRQYYTCDIAIVAFPDKKTVDPAAVIDLTQMVKAGKIHWEKPKGRWVVRRYAIRNALAYNRPPPVGGKGLECDKLDKDAVDAMFDGMIGKFIRNSPGLVGTTIKAFEADSWEVGNPEWTALFRKEFIKRRGYDPAPWMITYHTDRIVGDSNLTKRFLSDMYLTQTDLFADNFFTHLANKADSLGMEFMTEPYTGPFDPVRMAGRVQVPMGEFWVSTERMHTLRWAASAANAYGKKAVAAEAFTGRWNDGNWKMDPFAIKRVGDLAFCNGVNEMVLHGTALQPWGADLKPGMNMFFWGTMFVPGQTWWAPGRAWVNYLSRCQYLLREGHNVADVVGLLPTLDWMGTMPMGLHKQYNYDLIPEELLFKLDYRDDFFYLPSGARYRVLLLPKTKGRIAPAVLQRLRYLVAKGGTVVCQDRPFQSSSLSGYPGCDAQVQELAQQLWGKADGKTVFENRLGAGRLIWTDSIWQDVHDEERRYFLNTRTKNREFWEDPAMTTHWSDSFLKILKQKAPPDVEVVHASGKAMAWGGWTETGAGERTGEDAIAWTHRRTEAADIYFLSSQVATPCKASLLFRIKDKIPQIWDPVRAKIFQPATWKVEGDRTRMEIPFTPFGSVFVIFTSAGNTRPAYENYNDYMLTDSIMLSGKWNVSFQKDRGAPAKTMLGTGSWTESTIPGIKYFSGTATYQRTIEITEKELTNGILLDLGCVQHLAEIAVNGVVADTLWGPPFRSDISGLLRPGKNLLTIKVTNTWWNRMVGDEQLPEDLQWRENLKYAGNDYKGYELKTFPDWVWSGKPRPSKGRISFTPWRFVEKDSPLQEAGLLGPVRLLLFRK